jgi:hypothetical protein
MALSPPRTALIYMAERLGDGVETEARGMYCGWLVFHSRPDCQTMPCPYPRLLFVVEDGGWLRATLHGSGCWRFHPHPIPFVVPDPSPMSHQAITSLASTRRLPAYC